MVIETAKIGPAGVSLADRIETDEAMIVGQEGGYLDDIHFSVHLSREGERIKAMGTLRTSVSLNCVRCLEEFEQRVNSKFDIIMFPVHEVDGGSIALNGDDMETIFFDGIRIDLSRILSEQVNICVPIHPICRSDCRGICPNCGVNLNFESCQCEQPHSEVNVWSDKLKR